MSTALSKSQRKWVGRCITMSMYLPAIFLSIITPQLAFIYGAELEGVISTVETKGVLGFLPVPGWLVLAAMILATILSMIRELHPSVRLVPAVIILLYGATSATNYSSTDLAASAILEFTYLSAFAISTIILLVLGPTIVLVVRDLQTVIDALESTQSKLAESKISATFVQDVHEMQS